MFFREGCGLKLNCRKVKVCIFCKYWLGKQPDVNYRTGECKVKPDIGKCSLDKMNQDHKADGLCNRFEKDIVYM